MISRVGLLVVYVCTIAVVARAQPLNQAITHVRLAFDASPQLGRGAIRSKAVDEVARLWEPYGLAVSDMDDGFCDSSIVVRVVDDESRDRGDNGLGSVRFARNGVPEPTLIIHYAAVVRLASEARLFGLDASAWPIRLRDDVIGRALGRALAHELGHFVLRSPHHAKAGLMRAALRTSTLTVPARDGLGLTSVDLARLHVVVAAGVLASPDSQAVPAVATLLAPATCLASTH